MARLAYLGTPSIAVAPMLALLEAGHRIELVLSRPDVRRGRGGATQPSPLKRAALEHGLKVSDDLADLAGLDVELGIVVAYGRLIPTALLDELAMLNLHFSLLPRWRGAAPLERAILAGDERTGVCVMGVAPELDSGPIYACKETLIADKSLAELQVELSELGASMLVELLAEGVEGLASPSAQLGEPSYATKISSDELEIRPDDQVARVRALVALGRAWLLLDASRLRVLKVEGSEGPVGPSGTLDGTRLSLGDGALELLEVQPEGRRAMTALDWRRGHPSNGPERIGRVDGAPA